MSTTATPRGGKYDVRERFRQLAAEWKEQSRHMSNTAQMAMLKPYQQIIGMGEAAVPLILEELQRSRTSGSGRWRRSPRKTPSRRSPPERSVRWRRLGWRGANSRGTWPHELGQRFPAPDTAQPPRHKSGHGDVQLCRLGGRGR